MSPTATKTSSPADTPRLGAFLVAGFSLFGLILVAGYLYLPGLSGPFLLDDLLYLPELGRLGGIQDWDSLSYFLFSGVLSFPGRPLSLLSFLLNDQTWPTAPESFKFTNIALHLLNGVLIFWLCLKLAPGPQTHSNKALVVAGLCAALWLLAPLHVSTVLYVIQRMTQLATLFMLAGLIAYVHGRRIVSLRPRAGWTWMSIGIGAGLALGVLSKENAILLPLLALVVEFTLLPRQELPRPRGWWPWAGFFLFLPLLLLIIWVLFFVDIAGSYSGREYSLAERTLSQPRALFLYLSFLLVPRRPGTGLIHDDFVLSQGLLEPWTTGLALLGLMALLVIAFYWRRQRPVLAFGILWFLAGHLLESSVIALEPYFEHRNYLPAVGPFYAISFYVVGATGLTGRVLKLGLAGVVILSAIVLWQTTSLWGSKVLLMETWAAEHPNSRRAQKGANDIWLRTGQYERVERNIRTIAEKYPQFVSVRIQMIQLRCAQHMPLSTRDRDFILDVLPQGRYDAAVIPTLDRLITNLDRKRQNRTICPATYGVDFLDTIVAGVLSNKDYRRRRKVFANLITLQAELFRHADNMHESLAALSQAKQIHPTVDTLVNAAKILMQLGEFDLALKEIEQARKIHAKNLRWLKVPMTRLDHWERYIRHKKERFNETQAIDKALPRIQ